MCHDCPHRGEHLTGEDILIVISDDVGPHLCHNTWHELKTPCVGHQMQLENLRTGKYQVEDFPVVKKLYLHSGKR